MIGAFWPIASFLEFWRNLAEANGGNGSRRAPMKLRFPCRCMKSKESDWFGHIIWRGEEEDQRCLSYKGLHKKVFRLTLIFVFSALYYYNRKDLWLTIWTTTTKTLLRRRQMLFLTLKPFMDVSQIEVFTDQNFWRWQEHVSTQLDMYKVAFSLTNSKPNSSFPA